MPRLETGAIVGLGLIGASLGLALRRQGFCRTWLGIDPNPRHRDIAKNRQAVDEIAEGLDERFARADLVVLCAPVSVNVALVPELDRRLKAEAVITDVGSTKRPIVEAFRRFPGRRFVASHPLAGAEKTGPEAADPALFQHHACFLTPEAGTDADALDLVRELWQTIGMRIEFADVDEHDRIVARTSHLPHVLAFALAATQHTQDKRWMGRSLRDMTRLAASSPTMWHAILDQNREHVLAALTAFEENLRRLHAALENHDDSSLKEQLLHGQSIRGHLAS